MPGSESASVARESLGLSTPYEAPDGKMETAIAGNFAEVFRVDRIGANDDFFDLGGDSLLAETLSLLTSQVSGRDFQLSALMEHGTPRKIAALLACDGRHAVPPPSAVKAVRPPIFVVHGRDGYTFSSRTFGVRWPKTRHRMCSSFPDSAEGSPTTPSRTSPPSMSARSSRPIPRVQSCLPAFARVD